MPFCAGFYFSVCVSVYLESLDCLSRRYVTRHIPHGSLRERDLTFGQKVSRGEALKVAPSDDGCHLLETHSSYLPVTTEEFHELAENPSFANKLERLACERALLFQKRTASREIPPDELYEIYSRMEQEESSRRLPASLEAIWDALSRSEYLREVGCSQINELEKRVLKLSNIPGVLEGSALTTSRETFDQGIADLEGRLHFATYGDPVFETTR